MLVLSAAGRGERIWAAATETSLLRSSAAKPASLNMTTCVTPMDRSHKENPDKSSRQVLNANFHGVFAGQVDLRPGHSEMFRCSYPLRICCCSKGNVKYMGQLALKLFYASTIWDFCYLCTSGFLSCHHSSLFS